MRKVLLLIGLLLFPLLIDAQESPFFQGSFNDAISTAQELNKPCLVYFDLESG